MVISDYFKNLSEPQKVEFRQRVIEETGITYPSFYYKLRNNSWRKAELTVINNIISTIKYA